MMLLLPLYLAYGIGLSTIMLRAIACDAFKLAPWRDRLGFLACNLLLAAIWPIAMFNSGGRMVLLATLTGGWGYFSSRS